MIQEQLPPPPEWVMRIIRCFHEHNFQCYMVGGAVRDQLRRHKVYDYDLATDATPTDMKRIWRRIVPTGAKYGTMTLLSGDKYAEITTFRRESEYRDGRHPEQISFGTDIIEDLSRRDFTINAIAYDPLADRLIDPFDGAKDIAKRIIRTVGAPKQRLTEDSLRVLRAVRFSTTLDFTIEMETEQALIACAAGVGDISAERIREELERIIASPRCMDGFARLARLKLLPIIFTVNQMAAGLVSQHKSETLDELILRCLTIAATIDIEHDPGETPTTGAATRQQSLLRHTLLWYGLLQRLKSKDSEQDNSQILEDIKTQLIILRYSRAHQDGVVHLVNMLDKTPTPHSSDSEIRHFFFSVGSRHPEGHKGSSDSQRQYVDNLRQLIIALDNGGVFSHEQTHTSRLLSIAAKQQVFSYRDLEINGNDLQQWGYPQGKMIGEFMKHAVRYVCTHPQNNTRQHLAEQARSFFDQDTAK